MTLRFNRFLIVAACAAIGSSFSAWASSCSSYTTLDEFLGSSFSCTVGDKTFSDFTYSSIASSGVTPVVASEVDVSSVDSGGEIGLEFESVWEASGANAFDDSTIGFVVTVTGASELVDDAQVALPSGSVDTLSGVSSVSEGGCGPAPCIPGTWDIFTFDSSSGANTANASTILATPTGSVQVTKDISVSTGSGGGLAILSNVEDTFSQIAVPEPRTISMFLGLVFVAGLAFRKRLVRG